MKEKNMWKELLNRAGWLLIFFLATILYQIPIGVTAILTLNAVPLLQSGLIVAGISIVILVLFIIGARKTQLASFNFSFFRAKDLARLGFVVGTIVFALLHQPSNLPSLLIYGGMSIVLSWTAYKTQRLEMSILLHMIVNGVAFCLLALVVILSRTLGLSV